MAQQVEHRRSEVFESDGYTCQECGDRYREHEADGYLRLGLVTPLRDGGRYVANNLRTLCIYCNEPAGQDPAGFTRAGAQQLQKARTAARAATIEKMGDDALQYPKAVAAFGSLTVGASAISSSNLSPAIFLTNPAIQIAGTFLLLSTVCSVATKLYSRLSKASPVAQEILFADDDGDEEREAFAETTEAEYTRIGGITLLSAIFAVFALISLIIGLVDVYGLI